MDQITKNLFLGGSGYTEADLKRNNIQVIINVAQEVVVSSSLCQKRWYFKPAFYDHEEENLEPHLSYCKEIIDRHKNHNILVHCAYGISRSASIIIGYIMTKNNMNYDDAFKFVKDRRQIIRPNFGFVHQLKQIKIMDLEPTTSKLKIKEPESIKNKLKIRIVE